MTGDQSPSEYIKQLERERDTLQAELARCKTVMEKCKEKLALYRQHGTGEYRGGMEYTSLIALIDSILQPSRGEQGVKEQ